MSEVYTYQELRELALKHGIRDNKVHIGVWLQTQGYQKQRIQINHIRKIFYLKSPNRYIHFQLYRLSFQFPQVLFRYSRL